MDLGGHPEEAQTLGNYSCRCKTAALQTTPIGAATPIGAVLPNPPKCHAYISVGVASIQSMMKTTPCRVKMSAIG